MLASHKAEIFEKAERYKRIARERITNTEDEFTPPKIVKKPRKIVSKWYEEERKKFPAVIAKKKRRDVWQKKRDVHAKLTQVNIKQDKLNEALVSVQDFLDKNPNFTIPKNRSKAKELQQNLLRCTESQENYIRALLEKVRHVREYEQNKDMQNLKNNRSLLMKLLSFQAQTLPLWISTIKDPYAPSGVGACAVSDDVGIDVGDLCAAFYDLTWILARVANVHSHGKYDLVDIDRKIKEDGIISSSKPFLPREERLRRSMRVMDKSAKPRWKAVLAREKERGVEEEIDLRDATYPIPRANCYKFFPHMVDEPVLPKPSVFSVFRKRLIPLPKYRADPARDGHALFPPEAIVLALYPQTTCFYKGVVIKQPQSATQEYLISFEDKVYPSGWSPPSRVHQRYVVTYREIKSHKKKMNIFDEADQ